MYHIRQPFTRTVCNSIIAHLLLLRAHKKGVIARFQISQVMLQEAHIIAQRLDELNISVYMSLQRMQYHTWQPFIRTILYSFITCLRKVLYGDLRGRETVQQQIQFQKTPKQHENLLCKSLITNFIQIYKENFLFMGLTVYLSSFLLQPGTV